ncbi:MAG TPA: hypothetical protein VKU62_05820 [Thermoanaerobaculia bacterium]|nr:hypothetical protein [Thermoanaerobaculia bacterium]
MRNHTAALVLVGSLLNLTPVVAPALAQLSSASPGVTFTDGSPTVFATHAQFVSYGYHWGPSDGTFGAIPAAGNSYTFYGTAGSSATCSASGTITEGAYTFTGTLDRVTGSVCRKLFGPGDGPGWLFDKDYAGGGQLVRFTGNGTSGWLMPFHAEMQWKNMQNPPSYSCDGVPCFYASLGLAVSTDDGKTFRVAGQVFQPSQPLSVFEGGGKNMPAGYGSLIVADANGKHLENPPPDPSIAYFYLFITDLYPGLPGACGNFNCIGVERAAYTDVISAVLSGDPHRVAKVFHKYSGASANPWSAAATSDTQDNSGTAGTYAPLWTDEPAYGASVLYDSAFDVYLIVYPAKDGAKIRASTDLIHWSEPIGPTISNPGFTMMYPILIGETGDPNTGGASPRLYYSAFVGTSFPDWSQSTFETVQITLFRPRRRPSKP